MRRGRLIMILGLLVGLIVVAVIVVLYLRGTAKPAAQPGPEATAVIPTSKVIVALQAIPRGSAFAEGTLGVRDWPSSNVPPDTIADVSETIGKVAKMDIVQGQVIVRSMFSNLAAVGEASLQVPQGDVAIAIPIDAFSSVAYAIQPGDFVDVMLLADFVDIDKDFQTKLPNRFRFLTESTDKETGATTFNLSDELDKGHLDIEKQEFPGYSFPREEQRPRRVAQLTVESAKVLKLGPWIQPTPVPAATPQATPEIILPEIVTLATNPQDALVILWANASNVRMSLALRAAGEEAASHKTEAVTLQYLLARFNIAIPPRLEYDLERFGGVSMQTPEAIVTPAAR